MTFFPTIIHCCESVGNGLYTTAAFWIWLFRSFIRILDLFCSFCSLFLKGLFSIVCRSFASSIKNPSQDYDLLDAAANCKQVASTPACKCCWNVQSCPFYPRFSSSLNSAINFALTVYAGKQRTHFHINNKYIKLCLVSYSITIMLMKILYLYVPSLI